MGGPVAPIGAHPTRTALRVTAGPAVGQLILVDDELTVGRSQEGAGALGGDPSLSAAHAMLIRGHGDEWLIRDLGSAEGTFLNGRQLTAAEPLHRGDTLRLGTSKLLVVEGAAREPRTGVSVPTPVKPPLPLEAPTAPVEGQPQPAPVPEPAMRPIRRITTYRKRALAHLIDSLIATAIFIAVAVAFGGKLFSGLLAVALILVWDFLFESLRGQTIGKRAMKVRVVRRDGTRLRPQHVAARNVLRIIDSLPFVAILSMILSGPTRRQRIGDLAAGTIVVDGERAMSKLPPTTRDRAILFAYPVLWVVPVVVWALATPGATTKLCRTDLLSIRPPEGTCITKLPDGQGNALITTVNPGHTLHWQRYEVSLLAARARRVRRAAGLATVVGYKLAVTNTDQVPAVFSHSAVDIHLNIPIGGQDVRSAYDLPHSVTIHGFRPIATTRPIPPGATRVGWLRFLVPSGAVGQLNNTLASISFLPRDLLAGHGLPSLGDIRLWSPANAQGAAAAHIRNS
jgi:uncharacterized RDD family membrane protein YckC